MGGYDCAELSRWGECRRDSALGWGQLWRPEWDAGTRPWIGGGADM